MKNSWEWYKLGGKGGREIKKVRCGSYMRNMHVEERVEDQHDLFLLFFFFW